MKGKFLSTGLVKVKRYDAFFCLLEMSSDANSQNLLDAKSKKTDWNQCATCQENKNESLQCPADSKCQSDVGAGYKTLATNLVKVGGKYTRSCSTSTNYPATCFICDGADTRNKVLHQVSTLGLDSRVRECATALHDKKLLAKLSGGDLVALEEKYHAPCLAMLYKRAKAVRYTDDDEEEIIQKPEGIVLAELVAYIEESRICSTTELPVFKLADLASKYESRLQQLGCSASTRN